MVLKFFSSRRINDFPSFNIIENSDEFYEQFIRIILRYYIRNFSHDVLSESELQKENLILTIFHLSTQIV